MTLGVFTMHCALRETSHWSADWFTAYGTIALAIIALVTAIVAYIQYREAVEAEKVRATVEVLREWSKPAMRSIMRSLDQCVEAEDNRTRIFAYYRLSHYSYGPIPLSEIAQLEEMLYDLDLLASRTWNLLRNNVVSARVLFSQIDYEILAAYFTLEDILAAKSVHETITYSDFRSLAISAQGAYRKRPDREVVPEYGEAWFLRLPGDERELDAFRAFRRRDRARIKRYRALCE